MLAVMQPALDKPWDDADSRGSVRQWIDERAAAAGLARTGPLRTVHRRPWSLVLRTRTSAGPIFFKATAPTLANDPAITSHLAGLAPDLVLRPLAIDADRRWMLLPRGGRRLRGLPAEALLRHWERLLPRYATLQRDTLGTDATLLALGALDRRPSRLAEQLRAFLASPAKTRVGRRDGLTAEEVDRLVRLLPAIAERADQIEAAGGGHSIQHDDLHDGNVFIGSGGDRIFDWGDAAVSHPFGSLVVTLTSIADRIERPDDAPELRRLRDAYLEPWRAGRSQDDLEAAIGAVERIYPLMRAMTWAAALDALPIEAEHEHRGAVAAWARAFLEAEAG